jgi:hypothetical protein
MRLLGEANWWIPTWTRTALRLPDPQRAAPLVPGAQLIPDQAASSPDERLIEPTQR